MLSFWRRDTRHPWVIGVSGQRTEPKTDSLAWGTWSARIWSKRQDSRWLSTTGELRQADGRPGNPARGPRRGNKTRPRLLAEDPSGDRPTARTHKSCETANA